MWSGLLQRMQKKSSIRFKVKLNDNRIPTSIRWSATNAPPEKKGEHEAKCVMISVWDGEKKESLAVDLWVEKTQIGEMNAFFYETLVRMSETYQNSTRNEKVAKMIRDFAESFADEVEKTVGPIEKKDD